MRGVLTGVLLSLLLHFLESTAAWQSRYRPSAERRYQLSCQSQNKRVLDGPQHWDLHPKEDPIMVIAATKAQSHYTAFLGLSRRGILDRILAATAVLTATTTTTQPQLSNAAATSQRPPLDALLYRIVRVREATLLESRLIRNGTFKDVQRSNIKLAVRFMVENYRLNDAFLAASTYLESSNNKRLEASQVGQAAVQNLYTILEYFDSADVENLKVRNTVLASDDVRRRMVSDAIDCVPL
jgi:hypothetical protein